ncbi:hypothetical protein NCC49_006386 [Naganishia albida]|nr:hypothetical protein NCC49_006386 [Naganishia albida]
MPLVQMPGYVYRFHRHNPGLEEPRARQSPHVSPGTSMIQLAGSGDTPVPPANYYPPAWENHPTLRDNMALETALSMTPPLQIEAQPTPQVPMSVASGSSAGASKTPSEETSEERRPEAPAAEERGRSSWSRWLCCMKRKVASVTGVTRGNV